MWLLAINGLCYLIYGLITGRLRERMLPIRFGDLLHTVRDTLHFKIKHEDLTTYNAVQKVLYIVVILAGLAQVVTGLAIWKPVQFSGLTGLLGGFQGARILHFAGMAVIVGFLLVHVLLALLVPQTLWAMLSGGPPGRPVRTRQTGDRTMTSPFRPSQLPDRAILDDHRPAAAFARTPGLDPQRPVALGL